MNIIKSLFYLEKKYIMCFFQGQFFQFTTVIHRKSRLIHMQWFLDKTQKDPTSKKTQKSRKLLHFPKKQNLNV
jgi:hypothetical protein